MPTNAHYVNSPTLVTESDRYPVLSAEKSGGTTDVLTSRADALRTLRRAVAFYRHPCTDNAVGYLTVRVAARRAVNAGVDVVSCAAVVGISVELMSMVLA